MKIAASRELLPLRAFDVDTVVRCGAQSGRPYPKLVSFIADTNRPDSQRDAVINHSYHNLNIPRPDFLLAGLIHCLSPRKAKNGSETRHVSSVFLASVK